MAAVTIDPPTKDEPKAQAKSKGKQIRPYTERVIIYDERLVWQASLPVKELMANLPIKARYVPDIDKERRIGMFLFGVSFSFIGFALLFPFMVGINPAITLGFGVALGGLPGIGAGYIWGPRVGRKPFWIIRRIYNQDTKSYDIYPMAHTYLMGATQSPESIPGLYLATSWHEGLESKGLKGLFTLESSNTMKAIQIASLVTMALCLVGVVIFLAIATSGP
ncbi:MAG: hypothetical protein ACREQA_20790 [Candidatus Binatia bacterium]